MIWTLARKELLVNLLSLRFALGTLVTVGLAALVTYGLLGEYVVRRQVYLAEASRYQEELAQTKVYSMVALTVGIPPSPLSIVSRGLRDLPTSVRVSPFDIPSLLHARPTQTVITLERPWSFSGETERPPQGNPLLRLFAALDLVSLVSTVLSLLALLLVFDAFSGEREQGTLSMLMANPVGRRQLVAGKFLGALATLAVPLTLAALVVLVLLAASGEVELDGAARLSLLLLYVASLLFLAAFAALGLLVSLRSRDSASALIGALLVWVVMVAVIPEGGAYLAQLARPRLAQARFEEESATAWKAFVEAYNAQTQNTWAPRFASSGSITGECQVLGTTVESMQRLTEANQRVVPAQIRYAEEQHRRVEEYEAELRRWQRWQEVLTLPSLPRVYARLSEALAATDLAGYDHVVRQARGYRTALVEYLQPYLSTPEWFTRMREYPELAFTPQSEALAARAWAGDAAASEQWRRIFSWDRVQPLDLAGMPRPQLAPHSPGARLGQAAGGLAVLAGFTVVLLGLAAWRTPPGWVG
ncbi:MAG: ABC transporter permease subunit [Candidatus Latescibacterota bacterium]